MCQKQLCCTPTCTVPYSSPYGVAQGGRVCPMELNPSIPVPWGCSRGGVLPRGGVLLGAGGWHCGPTPRAVTADPRDSPETTAALRLSQDRRHRRTVPPQHHERKVRGSLPTAGCPQSFTPISIPALGCASHRSRAQCSAPNPILPPQRRFRCWILHPLQRHGYPGYPTPQSAPTLRCPQPPGAHPGAPILAGSP